MMFCIGIRYLCGWAMATHPADRQRPEWPLHPDRVFMALTAAHFDTDGPVEEYQALKRLSALGSPSLSVSLGHERTTVTSFVPVNDDSSPLNKKGKAIMTSGSLAVGRDRQPRSFPVAVPEHDSAFLIWPHADLPEAELRALQALCGKVTAVGHSASLVQMWVESNPPDPNVIPSDRVGARHRLRVPWSERLGQLEAAYEGQLRPGMAGWQGYDVPSAQLTPASIPGTVFAPDLIVLRRVDGRSLGLESTLILTEAVRGAVMKACPDPLPEWISGHEGPGPNGRPSRSSHLAFLPLPHVDHEYADGRLLGVALALPIAIPVQEQQRCLSRFLFNSGGYPHRIRLAFGRVGDWDVTLDEREDRPSALRPETWSGWSGSSSHWATVTPMVLDRYPKAEGDAERTIRQACERVGLPEPVKVTASAAPFFIGAPDARGFPAFRSGPRGTRRFHTHAVLEFPEPVRGPLLIGAGRYRGYGVCRPRSQEDR
jgi:CRISPR-associated protein Csb2